MANFVPVPDVGEFVVVQDLYGENVINVYHVLKPGGWDTPSLGNFCNVFISAYNDHFAGVQADDLQYIIVRARDLTTQNGAIAEVNFPGNSGGNLVDTPFPGTVAACCSHKTGFAGRSFRGRTYLAGIVKPGTTGNTLDAGYRNDIENAFDALDGLINAAGGTWVVVSRYSGYTQTAPKYKKVPIPRAVGIATDIINNSCDDALDTMRRRGKRRGS